MKYGFVLNWTKMKGLYNPARYYISYTFLVKLSRIIYQVDV